MRLARLAVLAAFVACCGMPAFAQTEVAGAVKDARTGRPLPGARVALESSSIVTTTDQSGAFRLALPAGRHIVVVTLVGYALAKQTIVIGDSAAPPLDIALSEGAGAFSEEVTVSGAETDAASIERGGTLFGRELQALRGVTLDDPFRAVQSMPAVSATDDFYSEFAVRGSPFSQVGLTVDGIPTRYLMHAVHGVPDGGSIAMINTDAVGRTSLVPGSPAPIFGRHIGAEVDVRMREGNREATRGRAGLSGTSATFLMDGPLAGKRGSWLFSVRRSYLDLLLNRIEEDDESFAFGFTDGEAKLVFDVTPRHQLRVLAIAGTSLFKEDGEELDPNEEARVRGRSWLSALAWRYSPSNRVTITQQVYATGLNYRNTNTSNVRLDDAQSADVGWRADATFALPGRAMLLVGGDALRLSGRHAVRRFIGNGETSTTVGDFREVGTAASSYAQVTFAPLSWITLSPGVRADHWGPTRDSTASPWMSADIVLAPRTRMRVAAGRYSQFPDLEQVAGTRGGGPALRHESARHLDLGLSHGLAGDLQVQVSAFDRHERDVLWIAGSEPRRSADGAVQPGRGDANWANALDGQARGVEVVLRRDAPTGLSGWIGYAYGRLRYRDASSAETFWADHDQRHALSVFGHRRLTTRLTLSGKFRYGSNYPITGYIGRLQTPAGGPAFFGGDRPILYALASERNTLRLPAYARADVRIDRTFTWMRRRATLFAEVANVLDRDNLRNIPYGVDSNGRVLGATDSLLPVLPSAGLVVEW